MSDEKLSMSFDPNTIQHLGLKMPPYVLMLDKGLHSGISALDSLNCRRNFSLLRDFERINWS